MSRRKEFYHGSAFHEFEPGDKVLPSVVTGKGDQSRGGATSAWASSRPTYARGFAGKGDDEEHPGVWTYGSIYRVTPDTPIETKSNVTAAARSWTVQAKAWDGSHQDVERLSRVATGELRMGALRDKRRKRQALYDRDSRLTPDERQAADDARAEVDPAYAHQQEQWSQLADLLMGNWRS